MRVVFLCLAASLLAGLAVAQSAQYPPADRAGQCFARVLTPVVTETVTEQVLEKPATERIEVTPAVYRDSSIRVMVREAKTRHRVIPAVYETVEEEVMVAPERTEITVIPAQFETYTETVVVKPERVVWKTGEGIYGRSGVHGAEDAAARGGETHTGEVLCRVIEPAVTRTVTRSRMIAPPRTQERVIPARYKTVTRRKVVEPARVVEEVIPAVYEDRSIRVMVEPPKERRVEVPAVYRTVEREIVRGGGEPEWAEVLCETNTTDLKVAEIQGALSDAGFPTLVDGAFGPRTEAAMEAYQRANGLSVGYLTVETVRSLGVDPYGEPSDAAYAALAQRSA
ncbi:MAG: peptidoglycan-binding protein [Alphaproteobacteria bacterium]|nr:peptidoglycan-binding protein [Alphaproteobacteria bacterium]